MGVKLLVRPQDLQKCDQLLIEHHYLHSAQLVGEQLRYAVTWKGQWLAVATWSAAALHLKAPIYDIVNNTTGKAQLGRVLHLTLYAKEKLADGTEYWDMRRIIVRGTTVMNTR